MEGYWNNPASTAEVMTADKFMPTIDVGCMSDDGFVEPVDCTKDMIICSDFNVYPRNIEKAI